MSHDVKHRCNVCNVNNIDDNFDDICSCTLHECNQIAKFLYGRMPTIHITRYNDLGVGPSAHKFTYQSIRSHLQVSFTTKNQNTTKIHHYQVTGKGYMLPQKK